MHNIWCIITLGLNIKCQVQVQVPSITVTTHDYSSFSWKSPIHASCILSIHKQVPQYTTFHEAQSDTWYIKVRYKLPIFSCWNVMKYFSSFIDTINYGTYNTLTLNVREDTWIGHFSRWTDLLVCGDIW